MKKRNLSPEDVWKRLKEHFVSMGLPTVYRNLEQLSDENIIFKVIHPNRHSTTITVTTPIIITIISSVRTARKWKT
jgi:Fe2+ or Zn2+ uptake regulation protein